MRGRCELRDRRGDDRERRHHHRVEPLRRPRASRYEFCPKLQHVVVVANVEVLRQEHVQEDARGVAFAPDRQPFAVQGLVLDHPGDKSGHPPPFQCSYKRSTLTNGIRVARRQSELQSAQARSQLRRRRPRIPRSGPDRDFRRPGSRRRRSLENRGVGGVRSARGGLYGPRQGQ